MLVTMQQLKMGMACYLKKEVLPSLDPTGFAGFGVSFVSALAIGYVDRFLINLSKNPLFAMFEIVDSEGRIESQALAEAIEFAMPETGFSVTIGKGSKLTFRSEDAKKLCEYIER